MPILKHYTANPIVVLLRVVVVDLDRAFEDVLFPNQLQFVSVLLCELSFYLQVTLSNYTHVETVRLGFL